MIQIRLATSSFEKSRLLVNRILVYKASSYMLAAMGTIPVHGKLTASTNCRFHFQKRSQLFIRSHNETLSVVLMRVSNPDRSPLVAESELANLQCFSANFPLWRQK